MKRFATHFLAHGLAGTLCWVVICLVALRATDEPIIFRYVPIIALVLGFFPVPLAAPAFMGAGVLPAVQYLHAGMLAGGVLGALVDRSPMTALLTGIYGYWVGVLIANWRLERA